MAPPYTIASGQVGKIAGPLFVGYLVNWGLHGVLTAQVYLYYIAFGKDNWQKKVLVGGVYSLGCIQTVIFTWKAYDTFGKGNVEEAVYNVAITWFATTAVDGMIACAVQSFYAYRIHILGKSKWLACFIFVLAFIQLAGVLVFAVKAKQAGYARIGTLNRSSVMYIAGVFWIAGGGLNDVLIAVSMIHYLRRRDTGVEQTHILLAKLIRLTVETGTVTAGIALLTLITPFIPGGGPLDQCFIAILGQVYANSLMVSLNNRMQIGTELADDTMIQVLSLPVFQSPGVSRVQSLRYPPGVNEWSHGEEVMVVRITKEMISDSDFVDHISEQAQYEEPRRPKNTLLLP